MRYKITVVGAGNVGATCAQLIAQADLADVAMVDVAAELATGKALDMMESAPVLGFNARITGGGDYDAAPGSQVCVVTASRDAGVEAQHGCRLHHVERLAGGELGG